MDTQAFDRLKYGTEQDIHGQYKAYLSAFVRYICNAFRCPKSHAEEIYPEAFSILYYNIHDEKLKLPLTSTMQTYLNSIGWNLFHRRFLDKYNREKVSADGIDLIPESRQMVDESMIQQERAVHVHSLLQSIGEPCGTLLRQLYYNEMSYRELSVSMALPETTLRKRKFDCLGKLRRLIDQSKMEL